MTQTNPDDRRAKLTPKERAEIASTAPEEVLNEFYADEAPSQTDAAPEDHIYHCICGDQLFHPNADNVHTKSTDIPPAARLSDEQIGDVIGDAVVRDALPCAREIDGYRLVARAAEYHAHHSRDAEVNLLYVRINAGWKAWEELRAEVAEVQEAFELMLMNRNESNEKLDAARAERDAALERERTLVEAFKSKEALVEFEALFASDGLAEEEDETSNEEDLKRFWLTVDRIAAIAASKAG